MDGRDASLSPTRPDGSSWPRISIVTPSYNQGRFIEETIRSVLLQGYPDLEYIIIDGASADESLDIIRKYEPWLTHWVSEKDRGQSHAINKGLLRSTGDIFQFINSDDLLANGALAAVAIAYRPGSAVAGSVLEFSPTDEHLVVNKNLSAHRMLRSIERTQFCQYHQPGVWLDRRNLASLGGFKEQLRYCFDYELTIRYLHRWRNVIYIDAVLVHFRIHPDAKTTAESTKVKDEYDATREELSKVSSWRLRRNARIGLQRSRSYAAISKIRNSGRGRLATCGALLAWMMRNPYGALTRFALGALKREGLALVKPTEPRGS